MRGQRMGGKYPPPLIATEDNEDYLKQCRKAAEPALEYYNREIAPFIYEMLDCGMSSSFDTSMQPGFKCHSNFIAKPVNSEDGPPMLFFDEVWRDIHPSTTVAVLKCQILGPQGHVSTGHNGCHACSADDGDDPINHPLDGDFDVGSPPCFLSSSLPLFSDPPFNFPALFLVVTKLATASWIPERID